MKTLRRVAAGVGTGLLAGLAMAAGVPTNRDGVEEIVVTARRMPLAGTVTSASEGLILQDQLEHRPWLRPAELLEAVPGLVVTQHSGDGKANQYFLRGFNLDHGTDFATTVDGIPVNLPTHAHGQGYTDLNFLIPELVETIVYRKGTYYADEGNFSAAGAAHIEYRRTLDAPFVTLGLGEDGYYRAVAGTSVEAGPGNLLLAGEAYRNDGPWEVPQDYRKLGLLAKYSGVGDGHSWNLEAMGYDGDWTSTDQVPRRAVRARSVGRFGSLDPTTGGETHRYSLSGSGWRRAGAGRVEVNAYAVDYALDLYSNFTYALDPLRGDQFEQFEERRYYGASVEYARPVTGPGESATFVFGVETRYDDISPVALYRTQARVRHATVREDRVRQWSGSAYASHDTRWNDWLRTEAGLRFDEFHFDVASSLAGNSGTARDSIFSPKFSLTFGPWSETEYFVNVGRGFHSNDARGTTITVDPTDGVTPADPVDPLVAALGYEVGLRTAWIPGVQLAAALWHLELDSELVFVGDGGTTEPSRASRREGLEVGVFYAPLDGVLIDADLAWTRARYTDPDPAGDRIPNAVESVASVGMTFDRGADWFGGARLRHFGPAPLIEDDSARSGSTTLVSLEAGYRFTPSFSVTASVFNLLDAEHNDITYFYESRLPDEPAPVADHHFHPVEPRTMRISATLLFE
jgi:outer membrane cobalamin receptor